MKTRSRKSDNKPEEAKVTMPPPQGEDTRNDESGSDDEMPEEVSNVTMKTNFDELTKNLESMKHQMKMAEKAKRKKKQEMFIEQKKAKLSKLLDHEDGDKDLPKDDDQTRIPDLNEEPKQEVPIPKPKPTRKVYPSLNIVVEPLTKVDNTRALAALDFRSRRLAKAPRESVKTAVISYQKKLQARKLV